MLSDTELHPRNLVFIHPKMEEKYFSDRQNISEEALASLPWRAAWQQRVWGRVRRYDEDKVR